MRAPIITTRPPGCQFIPSGFTEERQFQRSLPALEGPVSLAKDWETSMHKGIVTLVFR